MTDLGGRRFLITVVCLFTYTLLLLAGYLDSGAYVALQTLAVGAYLTANGHQKHTEAKFSQPSNFQELLEEEFKRAQSAN